MVGLTRGPARLLRVLDAWSVSACSLEPCEHRPVGRCPHLLLSQPHAGVQRAWFPAAHVALGVGRGCLSSHPARAPQA